MKDNIITEQDLIEFGFKRIDETAESSGFDKDWYYYTWDLKDFCLITDSSDKAETEGWKVQIFDYQGFEFTQTDQIAAVINALTAGLRD